MTYSYCTKTHIRYFIIKLLLDVICYALISAALSALVLWIISLTEYRLLPVNIDVILITLWLPLFFTLNNISTFILQRKYESRSSLAIQHEQPIPVEVTVQKKIYRELYHVSSIVAVKRTWKGIAVSGRIAAEYIYDPEIGRHDTEELDRILIPPYFGNKKGIVRGLTQLIRIDTKQ